MERRTGCRGLVLTLNNQSKDLSDEEAEKAIKRLLDALRRKAKRENWRYYIFIGFSRSNQKLIEKRAHFHVFLYADPCETVAGWICNYWNPPKKSKRRRLGIVHRQKVEQSKAGYFLSGYIRGQSEFVREQKKECELSDFLTVENSP